MHTSQHNCFFQNDLSREWIHVILVVVVCIYKYQYALKSLMNLCYKFHHKFHGVLRPQVLWFVSNKSSQSDLMCANAVPVTTVGGQLLSKPLAVDVRPPPYTTGAVLPLMKTLFDSVLSSSYGLRTNREGVQYKSMSRVVRAVLEDKSVLVGLDLGRQDAELFLSKVET